MNAEKSALICRIWETSGWYGRRRLRALNLVQHFCPFIAIFTRLCSSFQMVNCSTSPVSSGMWRLARSVSPRANFLLIQRPFFRSTCCRAFAPVGPLVRQTPQFDKCTSRLLLNTKAVPPTGSWMAKMMIMRVL